MRVERDGAQHCNRARRLHVDDGRKKVVGARILDAARKEIRACDDAST
jgi:hypothetical protein